MALDGQVGAECIDGNRASDPAQPAIEGALAPIGANAWGGTHQEPVADLLQEIVDDLGAAIEFGNDGSERGKVARLEQVAGARAPLAAGGAKVERAQLGRQAVLIPELIEMSA